MQTLSQLTSGELAGCTRLKLSCNLTTFPEEIFSLANTLEMLDLSQNHLSSLPDDFGRLSKLKIAFFSDNDFTVFPEVLSQCPQLEMIGFKSNKITTLSETALPVQIRWLILTNNRLEKLPASIGKCHRMQKLMLAGNQLTELPIELANCKNLGLLRISANQIQHFPKWLLTMPRLSWLAYSGNPFHQKPDTSYELPLIPWEELDLVHQLGEGASGVISMATWKSKARHDAPEQVAVKVFKGEVTSDGLPADEMEACIAAGKHPNLVEVIGKISHHPIGKQGLVFKLIPSHYVNLAGPPSFTSCTRDVFAPGTYFTTQQIVNMALGVASVAQQLHQKGIMHGDLYAHNTLWDQQGNVLFGDFGAANLYDRNDTFLATALEKLEVSAFGCLLDDLLQHAWEEKAGMFTELLQLRDNCIQENTTQRPLFENITQWLQLM